ncbi:PLP-dependent cysteine synthase family protein [Spelaeicoccus albus]|uniref:L-cysteine desulfhydrase Cds1 n=1 Tax=Spelaeicoccus albus TaxID=1280376 RepID=A0A7Z0D2K6_9MICO|nr:PLP-dependent cysteine synthase family protein [Spelaeicoccus albus]NYI67705.1 cysteine synthase A [Spelaeicoccus albus]
MNSSGSANASANSAADRAWSAEAVRKVLADANRSADTHLHVVDLPADWGIDLYLKDESVHPTGSLKHRLARSLFLYALVGGKLRQGSTVIEATSGNTAVSEAYFARMLGLPFVAVMPSGTSPGKIAHIESFGGRCHFVNSPSEVYAEAERLAESTGGHYLDQFTYAERATDWRGNNNIAESIYAQLDLERYPVPHTIVVAAGTGGTSSTIGRYIRYRRHDTRLLVADPENSSYYPAWQAGDVSIATGKPSRIEGIGRPRVEPSFIPTLIDDMIQVPDAASIAATRHLADVYGRVAGGSTGTAMWGVWTTIAGMLERGETGSIVTLLCDRGELYSDTYYDDAWLERNGLDIAPYRRRIEALLATGSW